MRRLAIFALLLLQLSSAVTYISSCGTLSANTEYVLTQDLTSDSTCMILGGNNIILDCAGHSITGNWNRSAYGIYSYIKSQNTIKNCVILNYSSGIFLAYSSNNNISDSHACNNQLGYYFDYGSNGNTGNNNTGFVNDYGGNAGFHSTADCPVHACNCSSCSECSLMIGNHECSKVSLTQNISTSETYCLSNEGPNSQWNWSNAVFDCQGNTISGNGVSAYYGAYTFNLKNVTFANCTMRDFINNGIESYAFSGGMLSNIVIFGSGSSGLELDSSWDNLIDNLTSYNNSGPAIHSSWSFNNTFTNTAVSRSAYGFLFDYSYNSTVSGMNSSGNQHGTYFQGSSSNNLSNTAACGNLEGFYFSEDSTGNSGSNNTGFMSDAGNNSGFSSVDCPTHPCICSSCSECDSMLVNRECNPVSLTSDILTPDWLCIGASGYGNKAFDCMGHAISGYGSAALGIQASDIANLTFANCTISNFTNAGIFFSNLTNSMLSNVAVTGSGYGFYFQASNTNNISNSYACGNPSDYYFSWGSENNTGSNNTGYLDDQGSNPGFSSADCPTHPCSCSSCEECSAMLADRSCSIVSLSQNISTSDWVCLYPNSASPWKLDCDGHSITGSGSFGAYLSSAAKSSMSNCMISGFSYGIYVYGSSNISLSNIIASDNSYLGIFIQSSANNSLSNITASNDSSYGIYLYDASDNSVSNVTSSHSQYGVYVQSSSGNIISNSYACGNSNIGYYFTSDSNNNAGSGNTGFKTDDGSNTGFASVDCPTAPCNCSSCSECSAMLGVRECSIVSLTQNISTSDWVCIYNNGAEWKNAIFDCEGNTISGGGASSYGAYASSISNATFQNCTMADFTSYGIYLYGSSGARLSNIVASGAQSGFGLEMDYSANNSIYNLTSCNNSAGIGLSYSDNNLISSSTFCNNSAGMQLAYSNNNSLSGIDDYGSLNMGIDIAWSENNTLSDIRISNSSGAGIQLDWSTGNSISNSSISSSQYGISLGYSNGNLFYNNFLNNTANFASEGDSFADWNTTQGSGTNIFGRNSIGGNFWATPSGDGFSQVCNDSANDGVCDSAYALDGLNSDYLPISAQGSQAPSQNISPVMIIRLRNNLLSQIALVAISLDGEFIPLPQRARFAPGESKNILLNLSTSPCSSQGQLVTFQRVVFYYDQGALANLTQAGSVPLTLKCS